MENLKLKISEIIKHCCDVRTFRLKLEKEVFYSAGQYLVLTIDLEGRPVRKVFSISSSPTEKGHIDFTKKLTGSPFSAALNALVPGDEVWARFPMGKFILKDEYKKIAFLSGGIGITPVRSILKYVTDSKLSVDSVLLYSSRDPEYLIFKDDFDRMCRVNKNMKVVYTLTDGRELKDHYESGYIDARMIVNKIPDYQERMFYLCGPPGMVAALRTPLLKELSICEKNIVTEDFVGY